MYSLERSALPHEWAVSRENRGTAFVCDSTGVPCKSTHGAVPLSSPQPFQPITVGKLATVKAGIHKVVRVFKIHSLSMALAHRVKPKRSCRNPSDRQGTGLASFPTPCTPAHALTHMLILLFISLHYSYSLASSFPPSDHPPHCLLATPFNSRQSRLIRCVPGTELRVICSRSHLGAESSWNLPCRVQHLTDHKALSTLPLELHLNTTLFLP